MPRSQELEAVVASDLAGLTDLRTVPMFGGLAWMWRGNLLCAVEAGGILFRLGKDRGDWAADEPHAEPMVMGGRPMTGWVRLTANGAGDPARRHRFRDAAMAFVETLPAK